MPSGPTVPVVSAGDPGATKLHRLEENLVTRRTPRHQSQRLLPVTLELSLTLVRPRTRTKSYCSDALYCYAGPRQVGTEQLRSYE